jgi:DNA-binding MarR family transcriptional regulator
MKWEVAPIPPHPQQVDAAHTVYPEISKRDIEGIYTLMVTLAPQPKPTGLTPKLHRTLELICEFIDESGVPPTCRELARLQGFNEATAHRAIKALERRGFIKRNKGYRRNFRVIRRPGQ